MRTKQIDRILTTLGVIILCVILAYSLLKTDEIVKHNPSKLVVVSINTTAKNAKEIKIAGSFNDWRELCCLHKDEKSGIWSLELKLLPGVYEYVLIVDGKPDLPKSRQGLQDGFGGQNQMLYVNDLPLKQGGGNA